MPKILIILVFSCLCATAFAQVGTPAGLKSPNLATTDEMAAIDGLTAAAAERVIANRPYLDAASFVTVLRAFDANVDMVLPRLFRPINLNTASREEIMLVPGMSRKMAHEFEEYRPYTSIEQFRREIGKYVDDEELARLERYVFVPLDLNSASADALATIPGMSPKMVHEFEEYRPYTSMEQFRREIGKYVDEDEVARFESYVEIRN